MYNILWRSANDDIGYFHPTIMGSTTNTLHRIFIFLSEFRYFFFKNEIWLITTSTNGMYRYGCIHNHDRFIRLLWWMILRSSIFFSSMCSWWLGDDCEFFHSHYFFNRNSITLKKMILIMIRTGMTNNVWNSSLKMSMTKIFGFFVNFWWFSSFVTVTKSNDTKVNQ